MASIYKKYRELVSLTHKYGEKYEKKYGDWIGLNYIILKIIVFAWIHGITI